MKVGCKEIPKARVLIAPDGHRSLVGRDWLRSLQYEFTAKENETSESTSTIFLVQSSNTELEEAKRKFPKVFSRKGRVKDYNIKIEFLPGAKITQQKGRRIPLQLQSAVDCEIKRLLKDGHIAEVKQIKDDVFIQPTVITVKKDRSVKIALDARRPQCSHKEGQVSNAKLG